jgi:hypothetical protein
MNSIKLMVSKVLGTVIPSSSGLGSATRLLDHEENIIILRNFRKYSLYKIASHPFFNIPTNAYNMYTLKSIKTHIKTLNTYLYMFLSLFKTILSGFIDCTSPSY